MYASWWGHYGRLQRPFNQSRVQAPWERGCPLGGQGYTDANYSTSHALVWCKQAQLRSLRTDMLVEVDRILGAADVRLPRVRREGRQVIHASTVLIVDPPALPNLEWAGGYLLDGNVDSMRGVPDKEVGDWLCTSTVDEEGKEVKAPRDMVVQLFRDVVALIVVDGRNLLDEYQRAVEDCAEVVQYMEGQEDPL